MSNLFVDKISGKSGTSSGAPITLSGDTATLGSGVTIPAAGITGTLGSGITFPAGHVVQVLSTYKADTFTTGNTFADVTGLYVTITPSSASNKILVFNTVTIAGQHGIAGGLLNLVRGSTAIGIGTPSSSRLGVTAYAPYISNDNQSLTLSGTYLDSPSATVATVYKIQVRNAHTGSVYVNRTEGEADATYGSRGGSTITVMEVVA